MSGMAWKNWLANKILKGAANLLYRIRITDEATAYKAFRMSCLRKISLTCRRFEFCPEVTAKLCRAGYAIHEVPISYNPRGIADGKKIRARDGFEALWTLVRYMFWVLLLAALPLRAQTSLYACMTVTKEYVVGAKLPPSGLFIDGRHAGFNHPFIFSLDYDPSDPSVVYLAAGNGLIRASQNGERWKILTGGDVTELRDVSVDRNDPATIYFAHSHGIRVSRDRGANWEEIGTTLHRKFTEAVRADRRQAGTLLAGGEEGIFRSEDRGRTWRIAGAAGFQVTRIEQSPLEGCEWAATTQSGGVFLSHDCAKTFENTGRIGVGATLYDLAFDPMVPNRVAVAGWGPGVAISEDGGKTWQSRNAGLPAPEVVSVIFDPVVRGRIYASVRDDGLYVSSDLGRRWSKQGLDGSVVNRMMFIPAATP